MSARRLLPALLLIFLFLSLSAFCEEDGRQEYPSGDKLIDITSQVKIAGAEGLKVEVFKLDEEIPPALENPVDFFDADKSWNSYEVGNSVPVRNFSLRKGKSKEYNKGLLESIGTRHDLNIGGVHPCEFAEVLNYCASTGITFNLSNYKNIPNPAETNLERKVARAHLNCFRGAHKGMRIASDCFFVRSGIQSWSAFFKQSIREKTISPNVYPVEKVLRCWTKDGKNEGADVTFEQPRDLITCWGRAPYCGYENGQSFDYTLLYNRTTKKFELYGEGFRLIKEVKLFDKKYAGSDIWHAPLVLPARTYPRVIIFEDNWGYNREDILPDTYYKGLPSVEWARFWKPHFVSAEIALRRTIIYNVETEVIEWEFTGPLNAEMLEGNLVRIPNVAKDGRIGYSLVESGIEIGFVPYDSIVPARLKIQIDASTSKRLRWGKLKINRPKSFRDCLLGWDGFSLVNYKSRTLTRSKLEAHVDWEHFSYEAEHVDYLLLVTNEFVDGDVSRKRFIVLNGRDTESPFSIRNVVTVPVSVLGKLEEKNCAWVTSRGLEIVIGDRVLLVKGVVKESSP